LNCRLEISQQQHQQSGDQASSNETHLQIHIVSDKLEGMSSGERHKMIEQVWDGGCLPSQLESNQTVMVAI